MVAVAGVRDPRVAQAMCELPRHWFVPPLQVPLAYEDVPLPVGLEATISAPHMVALQLETARLSPGLRVLELGSGSGYLLALVARLVFPGGRVVGVEIEPELVERSRSVLGALGGSEVPTVVEGSAESAPGGDPFDRLIVSFAQPEPIPEAWGRALRPGGLLVVPLQAGGAAFLETWRKDPSGLVQAERGPACLFVPAKTQKVLGRRATKP